MIRKLLAPVALIAALAFAPLLAMAQSSPGFVAGQVPTYSQWNSYFAGKQNYSPNTLLGPGSALTTAGHVACWGGYPGLVDCGAGPPSVTITAGTGITVGTAPNYVISATGGGGTGANPTATIGLTAVNGSATTFLRSDGAPPLSQAIVPTWTGVHTFSAAPVFNGAGTPTFATPANWRTALGLGTAAVANTGTSGANVPLLSTSNAWGASQRAPVTSPLSPASTTFTPNFDTGTDFVMTLTAAGMTLANPSTTLVNGQKGTIMVKQDATGGRTITTYGSSYKCPGGCATITFTASASTADIWTYSVIDGVIILTQAATNVF